MLCAAYRLFPGRSIRVLPNNKIVDGRTDQSLSILSMIEFSAECVPDERERKVLFHFAKKDAGLLHMPDQEAAAYFHFRSRDGLYKARRRAAMRVATRLNELGRSPLDLVRDEKSTTAQLASAKGLTGVQSTVDPP